MFSKSAILTCFTLALTVLSVSHALCQTTEPAPVATRVVPELRAYRVNPHPPVIDGHLNDSVWFSPHLVKIQSFTQREPDDGAAATESTTVAVAYDDHNLYVAFWCYDREPDEILRKLVRRDRVSESDRVSVRLDPYHDHQTGNGFEVSAAGVQRDTRYYNDGWSDDSWDAVWEADVQAQPWGWSAEMRIPYHCLRFADQPSQVWGVDFTRYICHRNESVLWSHVPIATGGFVSNFGHLTGLEDIQPARHLEVLPYVVAAGETEPKSLENPDGTDYLENAGFDLKYGISSNLILDATINPDFGQVELDQPILNLTAFETQFPEKRPFFLEGANLYDTDFNLFYSRRIGRPPSRRTPDPDFGYWTDFPDATTILGAAKVTGKVAPRTSVAFLSAITDEENGDYNAFDNWVQDTVQVGDSSIVRFVPRDTIPRSSVVEPRAGYSVLRVKQDVLNNSYIGGLFTVASQNERYPATTGGFDWRLSTNQNSWTFRGQTVFSHNNAEQTGFGVNAAIEKTSGAHWRGNLGVLIKDPHLNLNRLGFLDRNDQRQVYGWLQYRTTDDFWVVRNTYTNFNAWSSWNYDGLNHSLGGSWNTYVIFKNNWSANFYSAIQAEKYSDLETRGNGPWVWPEYPTFYSIVTVNTDPRKSADATVQLGYGTDRGGPHWGVVVGGNYRPRSNIETYAQVNYHRYFNARYWVTNAFDGSQVRSMFADVNRDDLSISAGTSFLLNRNLSFQLSAEGLIVGLDYWNHRFYNGNDNYSAPLAGVQTDYNFTALNSTMLIRWEFSPGSTLYLVWTRSRPEFDPTVNDLKLDRDINRFFSGDSENLFLIKASKWLNI